MNEWINKSEITDESVVWSTFGENCREVGSREVKIYLKQTYVTSCHITVYFLMFFCKLAHMLCPDHPRDPSLRMSTIRLSDSEEERSCCHSCHIWNCAIAEDKSQPCHFLPCQMNRHHLRLLYIH